MSILANPRHELMAQHVARGLHIKLAARRAGFLNADTAYKVSRLPEFTARVDEILEAAADDSIMEANAVLQALSRLALSDIRELFDYDENTSTFKLLPPDKWTNEISQRLTGLKFDKYGNPEVKFESVYKALEMLGRAHGLFKDGLQLGNLKDKPFSMINGEMTPEQAAEMYRITRGE